MNAALQHKYERLDADAEYRLKQAMDKLEALKKARRKSRAMPNTYAVGGRGVRVRYFKHRAAAIKRYKYLKKWDMQPYITSIAYGVTIRTSLARLDLSKRKHMMPELHKPRVRSAPKRITHEPVPMLTHKPGPGVLEEIMFSRGMLMCSSGVLALALAGALPYLLH